LEKKIGSMLFVRTALSRKPAKLAEMELKKELERKLHDAVRLARARLEQQQALQRENTAPTPTAFMMSARFCCCPSCGGSSRS